MIGITNVLAQSYDDNGRRWLIIVAEDNNPKFQQQIQWIENEKQAAIERKIGVIQFSKEEVNTIFNSTKQTPKITNQLQQEISKNDDFEVILIGLDGTIKLRGNKLVSTNELFKLIDSMPMRQREMKLEDKN